MKGYQRNYPCLCGSGKKWKLCHPEMTGVYRRKTGEVYKGNANILNWAPIISPDEVKKIMKTT